MGTYVSLVWDNPAKEDDEDYESVFKWIYDFEDELYDKHPELAQYGHNFNFKILKSFEKWLENCLFLVKNAPEVWLKKVEYMSIEQAISSIEEDLKYVRSAYFKAKGLEIEGKRPRLSIG